MKRMNTDNFKKMPFPGKAFQTLIKNDEETIKKLADVLNYYTKLEDYPVLMKQWLTCSVTYKGVYKVLVGIGCLLALGAIFYPDLSSILLLSSLIATALVVMLSAAFYTTACDYKLIDALVSRLSAEQVVYHSLKINEALSRERDINNYHL